MPLVTSKTMLNKARKGGYAVGHFNTSNLEFTQAIVRAAVATNSPVMIATSKSAISYAGYQQLFDIVANEAKGTKVPIALHLDHGPDMDHVRGCLKHGWTSIMRDASHLPYKENVREIKKAVTAAKKFGVPVEAELGQLKGEEGWVKSDKHVFTEVAEAKDFVKQTGCDSLAVSVGTSHGAFKFSHEPKIDVKRVKEIADEVSVPLVLHGASSVPKDLLKKANSLGADIKGAVGVPDRQVRAAIRAGIAKVNTDTDLRIGFDAYLREFLREHDEVFDPRKILGYATDQLQKLIEKRMKTLGSIGQA